MTDETALLLAAKKLITKHEGLKTHLYKDSLGNFTIGIGYDIQSRGLPLPVINQLCEEDIHYHYSALSKYLWFQLLNDARKIVILDLAYNLGQVGLMKLESLIIELQKKNYSEAAKVMLQFEWAKQVGQRAIEDAKIMETGEL